MARLSDQERQEVQRYLDADQPLPEKYRFLLFEDKRQVELVWNGKTNAVCNVVLPFQTIEQVDEPRAELLTDIQQGDFFSTDARVGRRAFTSACSMVESEKLHRLANTRLRELHQGGC
jgi:hypothetical protein